MNELKIERNKRLFDISIVRSSKKANIARIETDYFILRYTKGAIIILKTPYDFSFIYKDKLYSEEEAMAIIAKKNNYHPVGKEFIFSAFKNGFTYKEFFILFERNGLKKAKKYQKKRIEEDIRLEHQYQEEKIEKKRKEFLDIKENLNDYRRLLWEEYIIIDDAYNLSFTEENLEKIKDIVCNRKFEEVENEDDYD